MHLVLIAPRVFVCVSVCVCRCCFSYTLCSFSFICSVCLLEQFAVFIVSAHKALSRYLWQTVAMKIERFSLLMARSRERAKITIQTSKSQVRETGENEQKKEKMREKEKSSSNNEHE